MLDELKVRLEELLAKCPEENREKYLLIQIILSDKDWFNKVDVDDIISILIDLEYTKEEAIGIYMKLKGIN